MRFGYLNEETYCEERRGISHSNWISSTQWWSSSFTFSQPPCVWLVLFCLAASSPSLSVSLFLSFLYQTLLNTHTLKCHSVHRFTNRSVALPQTNTFLADYSCILPPSFSFHAELFSEVMNAIIWSGRWFHPELLAAGPSMKASVSTSSMAFPLGHC